MNRKIIGIVTVAAAAVGMGLFFHYWSKDDRRLQTARGPTAPEDLTAPLPKPPLPPATLPEALPLEPEATVPPEVAAPLPEPGSAEVEPDKPEPSPAEPDTPAGMIAQLGAGNFQARRQAEHALLELGAAALPELDKHADSDDPELRARVQRLRRQIRFNVLMTDGKSRKGVAAENAGEKEWPYLLTISKYDSQNMTFEGRISWDTLDAVHAVEGAANLDIISFQETKFIKQGSAILNCVYTFDLTKSPNLDLVGTLEGTWRNPDDNRGGSVNLQTKPQP